ncbi:MAG: PIN domain-containing protein [Rhodocyclaceae bacterium]|nr:PIN domain-containing protein [Rhodocyclaceae bacterium]
MQRLSGGAGVAPALHRPLTGNVLVFVLEDDPEWGDWSVAQLRAQAKIHRLAINPVIYSELSLTFSTAEALDRTIDELGLTMIEMPPPALFLASKAFVLYRGRGGTKSNVLADFFIGAHAAVSRYPILTRDTRRYSTYFSSVKLIAPDQT